MFLTGSFAYGRPTDASDIDLVVKCEPELANLLRKYSDSPDNCRHGKINFILLSNVVTQDREYSAWKTATESLIAIKPVSRDEAINMIDFEYLKRGLPRRTGDSN